MDSVDILKLVDEAMQDEQRLLLESYEAGSWRFPDWVEMMIDREAMAAFISLTEWMRFTPVISRVDSPTHCLQTLFRVGFVAGYQAHRLNLPIETTGVKVS